MAETGLVGVVADSTLTEVLVLGALSMLGGAEARPEGVTDWLTVEPSDEQASISCSNLTKSGKGPE